MNTVFLVCNNVSPFGAKCNAHQQDATQSPCHVSLLSIYNLGLWEAHTLDESGMGVSCEVTQGVTLYKLEVYINRGGLLTYRTALSITALTAWLERCLYIMRSLAVTSTSSIIFPRSILLMSFWMTSHHDVFVWPGLLFAWAGFQ